MDKTTAIAFLNANSPMPDDDALSQELIDQYAAAYEFFVSTPDPDSIGPLLNSFGRWGGFGMYQRVEDAFASFDAEQMRDTLVAAISSPHESVRYWASQIAALFPCDDLVAPLIRNTHDSQTDICVAAATALAQIDDPAIVQPIRELRSRLTHPSDIEALDDILADITP